MRFSDAQQKEIIDAVTGKFIGYIVDAEVNEKTGNIICFHVAIPKKALSIFHHDEIVKKVYIEDVLVIGKDVILVRTISE